MQQSSVHPCGVITPPHRPRPCAGWYRDKFQGIVDTIKAEGRYRVFLEQARKVRCTCPPSPGPHITLAPAPPPSLPRLATSHTPRQMEAQPPLCPGAATTTWAWASTPQCWLPCTAPWTTAAPAQAARATSPARTCTTSPWSARWQTCTVQKVHWCFLPAMSPTRLCWPRWARCSLS